jgi:uncharacterized protein (DUF433 family)
VIPKELENMAIASGQQVAILRTERGLTIAGTRISLYDVMDLLKAQYPPNLIRDTFNLTDAQIDAALAYIAANQAEVETEYQEVLRTREEIRDYWEERNRSRFEQIAAMPRKPEHEAIWAKLDQQKARRQAERN